MRYGRQHPSRKFPLEKEKHMKLWKLLAVTLLVLSVVLCMAACGGDPADTTPDDTTPSDTTPDNTEPETTEPEVTEPETTEPEKLPGELPHDCVWSSAPKFVAYETADANGAIGCLAPVCTVEGCVKADLSGETTPVLLNMDFQSDAKDLKEYVATLNGVAPYYRDDSVTTGMLQSGMWYNTTFKQVLFDETLGLRDKQSFRVSLDFMLGLEPSSKDRILAWGASGDDYAFSPRFMLSVDADGKLHYYTRFDENANGTAALSGYTFDDRMCWYHLDLDVNVQKQSVTVSVGKWADAAFTAYADYTTVGTCSVGFGQMAATSTHDCFRISDMQGLLAMDNFVISTPTKSAGGNEGGSDEQPEDLPGLQPHDCVWSTDTKFYTYEGIEDGVLGYMVPYCTVKGCKEVKLAEKQGTVLLNMDFETDATKLLDYVKGLDGVEPFSRDETLASGAIIDGKWHNTSFNQVIFGEALGLRNTDLFTISFDCQLGAAYSSKDDAIISWGGYGSNEKMNNRFLLKINKENKLVFCTNFAENASATEALSSYTFDDRASWYHFEILVDCVNEQITVKVGKWADDSLTALTEYVEVGTTPGGRNYFHDPSEKSTHDCFRISHKQGMLAMDNFIVSIPVAE